DLGEPDLDLIEPRRVSGREVKLDSRVLLEELADRLSFVRGEMVEDDVNLLLRRTQGYDLLQERDELTAGMAAAVLPWTRPLRYGALHIRKTCRDGSTRSRGGRHRSEEQ